MIPASPLARIAARLIELVVFLAIATLAYDACAVAPGSWHDQADAFASALIWGIAMPACVSLAHLVLTASAAGSLGKRVFRLRVCTLDGEPAPLEVLLLRELLFFLGLSVGVIPVIDLFRAFVRPDARGLSDLLLGTQVVQVSAHRSAS